jgi:hypothetical protein
MAFIRSQLPVAVLIAVTIASGAIAGVLGNRWGAPVDLAEAGARIDRFPDRIGEWEVQSAAPFDEPVREMLECTGSTDRRYRHRQTGAVIDVALQVGPPGPTAVHTPDVCFSSQAYTVQGPRKQMRLDGSAAAADTFWEQSFQAKSLEGERLEVVYAWNDGGRWTAAERPRYQYAGRPLLYKMMVVARSDSGEEREERRGRCRQFLEALLPLLDSTVLVHQAS